MPVLTVRHETTYRYRQPVLFGEHRMMFRPREGHDQRILSTELRITPRPESVRWIQDVFGNTVGVARFDRRAAELRFESTVTLEQIPAGIGDFLIEEHAQTHPFSYGAEEMPDLLRSIERAYFDPEHTVDAWARDFLPEHGPADTREMLIRMTQAIRRRFVYIARDTAGVQDPLTTLRLGSGTCRDFALLMMEALRSLGFATRFVSGYLHSPRDAAHLGGGSTHAWVRVYLPGAGWVEFDPTNGIVGSRDLIRVAVVRDPRQAVPLSGSYVGFPSDHAEMAVSVTVTAEETMPVATAPRRAASGP